MPVVINTGKTPGPGWLTPKDGSPPKEPKALTHKDYSGHLGDPPAPPTAPVQTTQGKEVQGVVQVGEAITHIPVHSGVIGTAKVGCGGSRTVNLGNYESIKLSVYLEMPCDKDTLPQTWEFVSDWVGDHLSQALEAVKGK